VASQATAYLLKVTTRRGTGYEIIDAVGFTLALPLVALLAASAVLGPEIDDGSIVYLIAKPVPASVSARTTIASATTTAGISASTSPRRRPSRAWAESRRIVVFTATSPGHRPTR
jgi:hypothetical protein